MNNMPLTLEDLQEMEIRCEAARPGPWRSYVERRDHLSGSSFIMVGAGPSRDDEDLYLSGNTDADQDFIAAARQDVPRLIAEVRRLRTMLGLPT
jgi:hypothetical protein